MATPELRLPKNQAALRDAATGARGLAGQWQEAEARVAGLAPLDKDLERLSQQSAPSELAFLVGALEQPLPPLPPRSDLPGRLDLLDRRKVALYRWTSDLLAVVGGAAGVFLVAFGATRSGGAAIPVVVGGLVLLVLVGLGFFAPSRAGCGWPWPGGWIHLDATDAKSGQRRRPRDGPSPDHPEKGGS